MTAPAVPRRWREPAGREVIETVRGHVVCLRRRAPLVALLATGILVHAAVVPHLLVAGLAPDVLLVAVVAVAAASRERSGAAFGFASGLGADLFLATPLGTAALAYTLLGHLVGIWSRRAAIRRSIPLVFVGVLAGGVGTAAVATALGGIAFPAASELVRLAGVAALSAPLGPPVAAVVHRLVRASGARP